MNNYSLPKYMNDAPPMVRLFVVELAEGACDAMRNSLIACYPKLNPDSLEFSQMIGAVFHVAAQKCVEQKG